MAPDVYFFGPNPQIIRKNLSGRPSVDDVPERSHAGDITLRNFLGQPAVLRDVISEVLPCRKRRITKCNMDETPADRLRIARAARKYRTAKQFSDTHGIPQSTYSTHETGTRGLSRNAALKYATLLDISVEWLLTGKGAGPEGSGDEPENTVYVSSVPVVGAVQAGNWVEAVQWESDEWYEIAIPPDGRFPNQRRYGLEVRGPSMNELYPDGSVVICIKLIDLGREPRHGERVVVERRRYDGCIEATVKEFRVQDEKVWLWPRSTHPAFQQPVPLACDGDEEVAITGVVVGSYRAE
ncbi:LexA family protein [Azospirillum himalayense]|uniref:LexA family protein n=1 Tax=Azospirillum himalayense TaxID=654847 RepID=A0ABW0GBD2_9PROT